MTRSTATFRHMALLALVAVLLAVVAPTVSRVLAPAVSKGAPVLLEIRTTAGMKLIDVSPFLGSDEESPAHTMTVVGEACGYCMLAPFLPVLLVLLFALLLWNPGTPGSRPYSRILKSLRNTRGLGSQAPPITL